MSTSPETRAASFVEANDKSLVIAGRVRSDSLGGGAVYTLEDRTKWRLSMAVCRALPTDYPKWKLP